MKKLLKRLLSNKGMTLVELIVVLFVSSVILAIAGGLVAPVKELMKSLKSNAHMDTVCVTANEYIRGTVQAATSLHFFGLDDGDNDFSAHQTEIMSFISSAEKDVKALAVLNVSGDPDAPVYRIFDFGKIASYTELEGLAAAPNEDEYGVFRKEFYEDASCAVEFYQNSSAGWLQVACQSKRYTNDPDEPLISMNQKHVLNFKLLNSGVAGITVSVGGNGTETNLDPTDELDGHCYLILYTQMNW